MGDASSVRLAFGEEVTFGSAASVGSGNWRYLRFTGEDFRLDRTIVESQEIDGTRQPAGSIPTSKSTTGGFSSELSLIAAAASPGNGFDPFYEGALLSDWSTIVALTAQAITISGVSGGTFTLTSVTTGSFTNVVKGQWMRLGGFATNGTIIAHITTKTSNDVVVVEGVRLDGTAVTNEVGTGIGVNASMLRIAAVKRSYSFERQYTDLTTPEYSLYTGQWVGTWERTVRPDAIVTERFSFRGKTQATNNSATSTVGTVAPKWATARINAVDDIQWIMEGVFTAIASDCVTNLSHTLDNRPRIDLCIGEDGPGAVGVSNPTFKGNYSTYMRTGDLIRKHENRTASKIAYLIREGSSARYQMVTAANLIYTNVSGPAAGNDRPVEVTAEWSAEPDADGVSLQIDRLG